MPTPRFALTTLPALSLASCLALAQTEPSTAIAELEPRSGSEVSGIVNLQQTDNGLRPT